MIHDNIDTRFKGRKSFESDRASEISSVTAGESLTDDVQVTEGNSLQIRGYLLKKSKEGAWQKRFFETNGNYLTYYKTKRMTKLLAALSLADVGEIAVMSEVNDLLGAGVIFQLELKDKSYLLRARTAHQAEQWIKVLKAIKAQSGDHAPAVDEARNGSSTKLNTAKKSDKVPAAAVAETPAPAAGKCCCVIS